MGKQVEVELTASIVHEGKVRRPKNKLRCTEAEAADYVRRGKAKLAAPKASAGQKSGGGEASGGQKTDGGQKGADGQKGAEGGQKAGTAPAPKNEGGTVTTPPAGGDPKE